MRISDWSSDVCSSDLWPVEPGRYRLVAAKACPWANRAIIVRNLLGLEDVISIGMPGPTHDKRSWTFDLDPGGVDPVLRSEEHTSELQSLMRISYAVFCLRKKKHATEAQDTTRQRRTNQDAENRIVET